MNEKDDLNSPSNCPLVTVVTPSFNQGRFIRDTIDSVLSQDYPNLEYWVIDGGSHDETQDVLKSYGNRLSWVSERDQGQADAVNKGFRRAKGEIFGWLNSDDTYWPGAIQKAVQFFQANPDISMVYGEAYNVDAQGKFIERYYTEGFDYHRLAETCFICQPTVFLRRHVFEEVGPLDVTLHYCLDYEYWMRVGKRFRVGYMPEMLATSRFHGAAKTVAKRREAYQEIIPIIQRHYSLVPLRTIYLSTYVALMEKLIPNVQGLYPNGWATSHVTILLRGNQAPSSFLRIKGYIRKNRQPLRLQLTVGGKTVETQVHTPGAFSLWNELGADDVVQIDAKETSEDCDQCTTGDNYSLSPEEPPFSYHLARGCAYAIQKVTIVDAAGRQKVLFSKRVTLIFFVALPVLIIRNTLLINRRLSFCEQVKTVLKLSRSVFSRSQVSRN
jgi:glycosyltransferase involved in cell wall biosynthesis